MGVIRPSVAGIVGGRVVHPKDIYCKIRIDVPKFPAKILLDDIKQDMIENIGYGYGADLWSYITRPYPESHHIDNPVDVALMRLFGRTSHLQWDLNIKPKRGMK